MIHVCKKQELYSLSTCISLISIFYSEGLAVFTAVLYEGSRHLRLTASTSPQAIVFDLDITS
jgi:hypothetical protein